MVNKHGRAHAVGNTRRPFCICGRIGTLSHEHDAYFCEDGGIWLEPKCSDNGCHLCKIRPDSPPKAVVQPSMPVTMPKLPVVNEVAVLTTAVEPTDQVVKQ